MRRRSSCALADESRSWTAATHDVGVVYRLATPLALAVNAGWSWRAPTLHGHVDGVRG